MNCVHYSTVYKFYRLHRESIWTTSSEKVYSVFVVKCKRDRLKRGFGSAIWWNNIEVDSWKGRGVIFKLQNASKKNINALKMRKYRRNLRKGRNKIISIALDFRGYWRKWGMFVHCWRNLGITEIKNKQYKDFAYFIISCKILHEEIFLVSELVVYIYYCWKCWNIYYYL